MCDANLESKVHRIISSLKTTNIKGVLQELCNDREIVPNPYDKPPSFSAWKPTPKDIPQKTVEDVRKIIAKMFDNGTLKIAVLDDTPFCMTS